MTPDEYGRALNAAVLEVMPERRCSGCLKVLPLSTPSEPEPMEDGGGLLVLFWCNECGAKPKAEA